MLAFAYAKQVRHAAGYSLVSTSTDINTIDSSIVEIPGTRITLSGYLGFMKSECFRTTFDFFKMCVPAICYAVQKNLLFVAISNLDAAVFQVAYQGKILTTAMFSVIMLGKKLTKRQVFALFVLLAGVGLVQISSADTPGAAGRENENVLVGTLAVLASCVISGFAAIYFEWILKKGVPKDQQTSHSLWVRNFQLAIFAGSAAAVGVWTKDGKAVNENGVFQGFNLLVWVVTFLEAFGGIVVALVIKYADNILKNFATAVAIVTSVIVSAIFLGFVVTPMFVLGSCFVMAAVVIYTSDPTRPLLTRGHEKIEESPGQILRSPSPNLPQIEMGSVKSRNNVIDNSKPEI